MNKKVIIFLCAIFVISINLAGISSYYIMKNNKKIKNIEQQINKNEQVLSKIVNENQTIKNKIEDLNIKYKDEIEEKNIWLDMNEQINQALLS